MGNHVSLENKFPAKLAELFKKKSATGKTAEQNVEPSDTSKIGITGNPKPLSLARTGENINDQTGHDSMKLQSKGDEPNATSNFTGPRITRNYNQRISFSDVKIRYHKDCLPKANTESEHWDESTRDSVTQTRTMATSKSNEDVQSNTNLSCLSFVTPNECFETCKKDLCNGTNCHGLECYTGCKTGCGFVDAAHANNTTKPLTEASQPDCNSGSDKCIHVHVDQHEIGEGHEKQHHGNNGGCQKMWRIDIPRSS